MQQLRHRGRSRSSNTGRAPPGRALGELLRLSGSLDTNGDDHEVSSPQRVLARKRVTPPHGRRQAQDAVGAQQERRW